MALKDTNSLQGYIAASPPQLGADRLYLTNELKKIQDAITQLIRAAQALENRIDAGGL